MNKILTPLAAAILLASGAANANDEDTPSSSSAQKSLYHIYIGAMYNQPDRERTLTDYGYGFVGAVGIPLHSLSNRVHLELGGSHTTYRTGRAINSAGRSQQLPVDFYRNDLTANLQYAFGDRDELTPFVLAGLGIARTDVAGGENDRTHFTANIGAGLIGLMFGDAVRGRVDVRGVYDDYSDNLFDAVLTAGIEVPLGRTRIETVTQTVDRVVEKEIIKEIVKEVEPLDSDGDGIPDYRDDCPDTLKGARTDNRGCAIGQTLTIENIEFDFNKATLTSSSTPILNTAAKFLNSQDNLNAVVAGHTDDIGSDQYNQKLSEARANSVRNALIERGVNASRLKSLGLGESFPRVPNDSDENRSRNRRVELLLSAADRPNKIINQQVPEGTSSPNTNAQELPAPLLPSEPSETNL
jgi:OOP family OmpA-OmpF porin